MYIILKQIYLYIESMASFRPPTAHTTVRTFVYGGFFKVDYNIRHTKCLVCLMSTFFTCIEPFCAHLIMSIEPYGYFLMEQVDLCFVDIGYSGHFVFTLFYFCTLKMYFCIFCSFILSRSIISFKNSALSSITFGVTSSVLWLLLTSATRDHLLVRILLVPQISCGKVIVLSL